MKLCKRAKMALDGKDIFMSVKEWIKLKKFVCITKIYVYVAGTKYYLSGGTIKNHKYDKVILKVLTTEEEKDVRKYEFECKKCGYWIPPPKNVFSPTLMMDFYG